MAATQTTAEVLCATPHLVTCIDVTTPEPGATITMSHGGPSGVAPDLVTHEVRVRATSRDPVDVSHIVASDSTANNTAAVVIDTIPEGDLTGATIRVFFHFWSHASGGLTNVA